MSDAYEENLTEVKRLLKAGVSPAAESGQKQPLHEACEKGNIAIVKELLCSGVNVNLAGKAMLTTDCVALHVACAKGHDTLTKFLIEAGAELERVDSSYERTPLIYACADGNAETVEILLNAGANVTTTNKNSLTALHYAVEGNYPIIVSLLLNAGAKNRLNRAEVQTLLESAKEQKNYAVVQVMEKYQIDQIEKLKHACREGKLTEIKKLFEAGVDVNFRDADGTTPLHWAAETMHSSVVQKLIDLGAKSLNIPDLSGCTPLHRVKSADICTLLVRAQADVNYPDKQGMTPLHKAVSQGSIVLVRELLSCGAQVTLQNAKKETPLDIAKKQKNKDVLKLLKESKRNSSRTSSRSKSSFFGSSRKNDTNVSDGGSPQSTRKL